MSTAQSTSSMPSQTWGELISPVACVRIVVVTALLVLIYWSSIRYDLARRWINDGNWSHGWLIPVFSLYFLSTRRDELLRCRPKPSYFGAVILALSLALYFVSAWRLRMTYPQTISIVGAIFGVTLLLGGWRVMRIAWFPILFLLLAVPLPQWLYVELTRPMREIASTMAAVVMPLFTTGLHTEAQAVVIDYVVPGSPPGQLNVEEACSGMRLTMAFVTLGVAMAYLGNRPAWQRIVMVLCCLPIAILCNAIRVTVTGLLIIHGHQDWARGTPHQLLGLLTLLIALGLFALIGYVLGNLFMEEPEVNVSESN